MKKILPISAVLMLFGVAAFINLSPQNIPATFIPDAPDAQEIQQTIKKAYEIEAIAACTFDTSEFASVFINDPRGGKLDDSALQLIQDVLGIDPTSAGYLDFELAYYKEWELGALKLEALEAKAQAEGRSPTPEELASLIGSSGRIPAPRACWSGQLHLDFYSISINGDTAVAIFNDGPRTNRMTLVKVNGQWYIAGNEILAIHP